MESTPPEMKVSLLWPAGRSGAGATAPWDACTIADLDLEATVDALALHGRYRETARHTLLGLCQDERVIRYRQDVLCDLLPRTLLAALLLPRALLASTLALSSLAPRPLRSI